MPELSSHGLEPPIELEGAAVLDTIHHERTKARLERVHKGAAINETTGTDLLEPGKLK